MAFRNRELAWFVGLAGAALWLGASMLAQDRALPAVAEGEAAANAPQAYRITLKAGEFLSGTLELIRGGAIAFEAFDSAGIKIKDIHVDDPGQARVGFAAAVSGDYRVAVTRVHATATENAPGTFRLRTETALPAARMRGVMARPTVRYLSPRVERLRRELVAADPSALSRFWAEARTGGGPLVEPFDGQVHSGPGGAAAMRNLTADYVLVTFLWREIFETHNVRVFWPQDRIDDFYMTRLEGSDVWYKTLLVRRGTRVSYALLPNDRSGDEDLIAQKDPLNARVAWDDYPEYTTLELDGAPDESWFRRTPAARGTLSEQRQFTSSLLKGQRPVTIYTPPGYSASGGPYPLLLIFDGYTYVGGFEAVPTLDNLISAGRIRPVIACFLTSPGTRAADIGINPNPLFAEALVSELLPWLRSSHPISTKPEDIVIGGYSAGGAGAARIALRYPSVFGNVLSQSGSFGAPYETSQVTVAYRDTERRPIRFYLDVGLYENLPDLPVNELALTEGLTNGNRHFRDVLMAKGYDVTYRETGGQHNNIHFRATLAEALMTLLRPVGR